MVSLPTALSRVLCTATERDQSTSNILRIRIYKACRMRTVCIRSCHNFSFWPTWCDETQGIRQGTRRGDRSQDEMPRPGPSSVRTVSSKRPRNDAPRSGTASYRRRIRSAFCQESTRCEPTKALTSHSLPPRIRAMAQTSTSRCHRWVSHVSHSSAGLICVTVAGDFEIDRGFLHELHRRWLDTMQACVQTHHHGFSLEVMRSLEWHGAEVEVCSAPDPRFVGVRGITFAVTPLYLWIMDDDQKRWRVDKSGTRFWLILHDRQIEVQGSLVFAEDITKGKRLEQKHSRKQTRLETQKKDRNKSSGAG